MDFKQLQSFVTVVQEESFTQAAGRLVVSQSTVRTHIHQLETELNTKLILRTTKSLQITPKGRELYEYALNILELKERMIQACSIESRRIIHLGASTIPSAYILPQLLADFGKLHQNIYFIIHQSDSQGIINGLKDGLFNLGFIGMSCEDSDFCCQPFCKDRMVVITPVNEHFLQYKQRKENVLPELLRKPLILREKGSGSKKMADNFLAHSGISEDELQIIARVNDRGPYVKNRIIDLSEKGAELLGYKNKGTTKVKVEVLERESRAIKEAMLSPSNSSATYGNQTIPYSNTQTAMAAAPAAGTAAAKPAAKPAKYEISTSQQRQPLKYTSEISLASNASAAAVNVPESAGEGPFFVQVGAFADYDKARQMADNM